MHHQLNMSNLNPKNGFMLSQSASNTGNHSRHTSQKSGKSAMSYQTQGNAATTGNNFLGNHP